jgi:hypothetical protein
VSKLDAIDMFATELLSVMEARGLPDSVAFEAVVSLFPADELITRWIKRTNAQKWKAFSIADPHNSFLNPNSQRSKLLDSRSWKCQSKAMFKTYRKPGVSF